MYTGDAERFSGDVRPDSGWQTSGRARPNLPQIRELGSAAGWRLPPHRLRVRSDARRSARSSLACMSDLRRIVTASSIAAALSCGDAPAPANAALDLVAVKLGRFGPSGLVLVDAGSADRGPRTGPLRTVAVLQLSAAHRLPARSNRVRVEKRLVGRDRIRCRHWRARGSCSEVGADDRSRLEKPHELGSAAAPRGAARRLCRMQFRAGGDRERLGWSGHGCASAGDPCDHDAFDDGACERQWNGCAKTDGHYGASRIRHGCCNGRCGCNAISTHADYRGCSTHFGRWQWRHEHDCRRCARECCRRAGDG